MDLGKLKLIKKDILKESLIPKEKNDQFCVLYVDGTGNLTFEEADATFWGAKVFSRFDYTTYLFVSLSNDAREIKKIIDKYPNTKVHSIPPLKNALTYNEWMANAPWFLIPPKHEFCYATQSDGGLIAKGWEDYVIEGDWDYIGSPWRSDIEVLAVEKLNTLRVANGGISVRRLKSVKKIVEYINSKGGQHNYFKGIKIDGEIKQQNSWLAEDAMLCSVGFTKGFFKELKEEDARKFGHEPIELSLFMDKNNPARPYLMHKIDC